MVYAESISKRKTKVSVSVKFGSSYRFYGGRLNKGNLDGKQIWPTCSLDPKQSEYDQMLEVRQIILGDRCDLH